MEDYPVLSAIAVVTFRADGASSAASRLQRRFNLLGCRMTACASDGAPVLETAWDVSNPEGTKLAPAAAEALELVVGVGDASQPGSIRAEFPDGTIVSGPRFEPALALELLPLTPSERAAARAKLAKESGKAAAEKKKVAPKEASAPPRKEQIAKAAPKGSASGGTDATARAGPPQLCAVELKRPAAPSGDWVNIRVLKEAANGAEKKGSGAKEISAKKGKQVAATNASSTPLIAAGGAGGAAGAATVSPTSRESVILPNYRSTRDSAAMQHARFHALSGSHAEQLYLFHAGKLPWHAAAGAAATP